MIEEIFKTKRNTSDKIEEQLFTPIKILDKGFIRIIDYMGDDSSIVQAARVSYGKGTKTINNDRALIRYLLKHHHTTPFEMCEIKFHIKAPIFVARQWLRHRTANVNEYSARYSVMPEEYYIPEEDQIRYQSASNKQGRGDIIPNNEEIKDKLIKVNDNAYKTYFSLIEETESQEKQAKGLAKEIARTILPVSAYTEFYWKIDLHNLLHFLKLRSHLHAQYEIREYAIKMLQLIALWVPITYEAFNDYTINSHTFSGDEIVLIKKLLRGEKIAIEETSLSKREWIDFCNVLEIDKE